MRQPALFVISATAIALSVSCIDESGRREPYEEAMDRCIALGGAPGCHVKRDPLPSASQTSESVRLSTP